MRDTGTGVIRHSDCVQTNWIRSGAGEAGFERMEAFFADKGYEMHRHDTYAVRRQMLWHRLAV